MKLTVETNGALERARQQLQGIPKGVEKAASRAINRALETGRTRSGRIVSEKFGIKAGTVKDSFSLQRANPGKLSGELESKGAGLPLRDFIHTPRADSTTGSERKQVRVQTLKLKTGFKWRGHIFIREANEPRSRVYVDSVGKRRKGEPISKRFGQSVPSMLGERSSEVSDLMRETFEKRLDHEVEHLLEVKK